jgi:hypothetical protein
MAGRQRSADMQDNDTHVCEALISNPRKCATQYSQSLSIKTHTMMTEFDSVALQNPSDTDAHCSQQAAKT